MLRIIIGALALSALFSMAPAGHAQFMQVVDRFPIDPKISVPDEQLPINVPEIALMKSAAIYTYIPQTMKPLASSVIPRRQARLARFNLSPRDHQLSEDQATLDTLANLPALSFLPAVPNLAPLEPSPKAQLLALANITLTPLGRRPVPRATPDPLQPLPSLKSMTYELPQWMTEHPLTGEWTLTTAPGINFGEDGKRLMGEEQQQLRLFDTGEWVFGSLGDTPLMLKRSDLAIDAADGPLALSGILIDDQKNQALSLDLTMTAADELSLVTYIKPASFSQDQAAQVALTAHATRDAARVQSQSPWLNAWSAAGDTALLIPDYFDDQTNSAHSALPSGAYQGQKITQACWTAIGPIGVGDFGADGLILLAHAPWKGSKNSAQSSFVGWHLRQSGSNFVLSNVVMSSTDAGASTQGWVLLSSGPRVDLDAQRVAITCQPTSTTPWTPTAQPNAALPVATAAGLSIARASAPGTDPLISITDARQQDENTAKPTQIATLRFPPFAGGGMPADQNSRDATPLSALIAGVSAPTDLSLSIIDPTLPSPPQTRPIRERYVADSFPGAAKRTGLDSLWTWQGTLIGLSTDSDAISMVFAQSSTGRNAKEAEVIFQGFMSKKRNKLKGIGVVFTPCGRFSIDMEATISGNSERLVFRGARPVLDSQCQVVGEAPHTMVMTKQSDTSTTLWYEPEDEGENEESP